MIAYNDDSFQDSDSSIIDLTLPTTGTYYAMVTSSPKSVSLNEPLTGDYELFMYTFAAGADPPAGDTMYAGSGNDTIIAGSADDTIAAQPQDTIVYGSGTVTMLAAASSLNVSAGTGQTVNEGSSVTLTGSVVDSSGNTTTVEDWHVVASSGQQIVDGTGSDFTFTPGNAGTYTVTYEFIDPIVGWDSADVVITSEDVPPVLTAPSASPSAVAGVSTSIDLGTLALTGIGPFTETVQWGDGQTSTFLPSTSGPLSLDHTYAAAGTYTIDETVSEYAGGRATTSFAFDVTAAPTSTTLTSSTASAVYGQSLTFTATVTGPGAPTGTVAFYAGPVAPADQIGSATLILEGGQYVATFSTIDLDGQRQPVCDRGRLRRRCRRSGQPIQRRQRNDHQGERGDRGHSVQRHLRRQPAHRDRHGHGRRGPEPGELERPLELERHHPYDRRYLHRHLDVRGQRQLQQRQRHNHRHHRPAPHRHRDRRDRAQPRTTPVSAVDVTFSVPIDTSSPTTGAVTLTDNGSPVALSGITFTLVSGTTSTYQVGDLSAFTAAGGSYTLTVNAADIDDQYGIAGTGTATVSWSTVAATPTNTAVTPSTATVSYGQSFTFTATVSSSAGAPPDGSVQFLVDGVAYGSAVPLSGSTAQLAISEPAGSYTIAAEYTGDANYAVTLPAAETSATLTVNQAATATSVAPGTATVSYGQSATFTATVSSPAGVPPDGSVQFLVNGVDYGSPVALAAPRRRLRYPSLRAATRLRQSTPAMPITQ